MNQPSEKVARWIVEQALGTSTVAAYRFPSGLCHHVYDVVLADGRRVVARLTEPATRQFLGGGVYWHTRLKPLGVPLPVQLQAKLSAPLPYVILERLRGEDLGQVYGTLDEASKRAVAEAVVNAQLLTAKLPEARGFGHALSYHDSALTHCPTWAQVITASLQRSRERITSIGVINVASVDRVAAELLSFVAYFSRIRPTPFLPDTTTKNVIVNQGRLTGIVDVDEVCFGDPLLTVGLTQMALMAAGLDTNYVEHWLTLLNAGAEQRAVVDFYTAVCCVDFLGEQGQAFNRTAAPVNPAKVAALEHILDELLGRF